MRNINEITDEAIMEALNNVYTMEEEQLLEEMKDADILLDEATEKRMRRRIEMYSTEKRRIARVKRTLRFCSLVIILLITVSTVGVATASVYKEILNPNINIKDATLDFDFEKDGKCASLENITVEASWLPEGYVESSNQNIAAGVVKTYSKGDSILRVLVYSNELRTRYDKEELMWELVDINRTTGNYMYLEEDDTWIVLWEYKDYICEVNVWDDADMDKNILVKIAEGVVLKCNK